MSLETKLEKVIRLGKVKYHHYVRENSAYRFYTIETEKPRTHFSPGALKEFVGEMTAFLDDCAKFEAKLEADKAK